ncbi:MAG TPA: HAMP domain-containing sensor histidine kinase [Caulobacterales bacterium]|nr:HAMP domain-containing sensor histidine kinase [Caulobacterales bacterium]
MNGATLGTAGVLLGGKQETPGFPSAGAPAVQGRSWSGRRFAFTAIVLAVAVLAGALAFVDWRMEAIMRASAQNAMGDELAALATIAREDGSEALQDALDVRSVLGQHVYHLLVDARGKPLAGNMQSWPSAVRRDGVWTQFRFVEIDDDGHATPSEAFGAAATLPDHSRLLIANDLEAQKRVRSEALNVFAMALLTAVAAALGLGLWLDRILIARIGEFARTADAVTAGRLDARVRIGEGRDELSFLARTMNSMLDRIEALMAGVRAVTDSLAHDLRTPLAQIASNLEAASGDERDAALDRARQATGRLTQTFETLIDIARAESGLSRESMVMIDLGELVTDLVDLFEPAIEDKGLAYTLDCAAATCRAHPQLLRQAIGNMLDNAIKYSSAGGVISVSVAPAPGGANIVIADAGPGIPPAQRELAATRFGRLERDAAKPGAGLGLSIAAATARLHGGSLRLEDNAPGLRAVLEIRQLG